MKITFGKILGGIILLALLIQLLPSSTECRRLQGKYEGYFDWEVPATATVKAGGGTCNCYLGNSVIGLDKDSDGNWITSPASIKNGFRAELTSDGKLTVYQGRDIYGNWQNWTFRGNRK